MLSVDQSETNAYATSLFKIRFFSINKKSVSEYLFENGICLPSGCNLKQEDQSLISLGIKNYLKNENI